jgi:hypothetical protein
MTFQTNMDLGDIADAQRLCTLARLRNGQFSELLIPVLILLGGAFGFAFATRNEMRGASWFISSIAVGFIVLAVLLFSRASRLAQRFQANGATTCTVTDQGLQVATGLQPWSAFAGYVDAPSRILLLYPSRAFFNITKSALSGAETTQLLSIVSKHLQPL